MCQEKNIIDMQSTVQIKWNVLNCKLNWIPIAQKEIVTHTLFLSQSKNLLKPVFIKEFSYSQWDYMKRLNLLVVMMAVYYSCDFSCTGGPHALKIDDAEFIV